MLAQRCTSPPLLGALLLLLLPTPATGGGGTLSFDGMFLNGAVLQQDVPVAVWGRGEPGRRVELSLDGAPVAHGQADAGGRWELALPPQATSWARTLAVSDGSGAEPISTVVKVGAVVSPSLSPLSRSVSSHRTDLPRCRRLCVCVCVCVCVCLCRSLCRRQVLCSGQSNMQMPVGHWNTWGSLFLSVCLSLRLSLCL
jgi:hypothetical protein